MWGWRARVGFIIPSPDLVQEFDAFSMAPEGVTFHFTRISMPQPSTRGGLMALGRALDEHIHLLMPLRLDTIVFGCTAASFLGGPGYDETIIRSITRTSGIKATTTATSIVAALRALGRRKISVLAPYTADITESLEKFLVGNGFNVTKMKALGLDTDMEIAQVAPESIYRHAREVDSPQADGLLISCTTFRASDIIDDLERDLGKPVVTANQATVWNVLRMIGIKDKINGYGQLLMNL